MAKLERLVAGCKLQELWANDACEGSVRVVIVWHEGKPTSTGRRDYYSVYTVAPSGRLHTCTYNLHLAHGYRLGKQDSHRRDWLAIDGCGFSKPDDIIDSMRRIAPELTFYHQVLS